jgi:hypothetical protein
MAKKNSITQEKTARVEIGGYVHQYPGRVTTKLYVSDINQPLVVDDADVTKKLKRLAVEMRTIEDTTPGQNVIYTKNVEMVQLTDEQTSPGRTTSTTTEEHTNKPSKTDGTNDDSPLLVEKFREVQEQLSTTNGYVVLAIVIAVIGAIVGFISLFH